MGGASISLDNQMDAVAHRAEYIELLDEEGPLATRDIVDALDHSRSTVTRALRDLRDADLVEKMEDGYTATLPGVMATIQYRRYETASKAILTSKELLSAIPQQHAPPVDLLIGAETISANTEIPVRPLEAISDRVREADTVHIYLPTLINTHLLRVWHRSVITQTTDSDAIFKPELLTALKGQYPHLLSEMATTDGFSAFTASGPPYGVVLTTASETTTVSLIVYENDATVHGVVTNEATAAVEWAHNKFERLKHDATEVTPDLDALSAAVTDGLAETTRSGVGPSSPNRTGQDTTGHGLPLDLEAEGFVRLSPEYFRTHNQAPPAVSWRTGFTLAEVHAGHPVDRLTKGGQNLTEHLIKRLHTGENHILLGPPGSGKSTICMAVACEWYTREHGPVLYRERGSGNHFTSSAMLEAYLRQTDGHTLVVVEDAIRDESNTIFDVMQALDEDESVTFLLDARNHEWDDTETDAIDARRDAYRRSAINSLTVPALDENECTRFVTQFENLIDADLRLTGTELFSTVQEGTAAEGDDGLAAGDVLIAQHYLTRQVELQADTSAESPTILDEMVHHTYQKLVDAKPQLSLELALLVNIFNAAGLPVTSEYLYAITALDEYKAVDEALSLLEGQLLYEPARPHAGGPTTYRTRHETWSFRFLEQFWDGTPPQRARTLFGKCISEVLALADDSDKRRQIKQYLGGRTPYLHQIEADPGHWADETVARLFRMGRSNGALAPLFGETSATRIKLPEACSGWTDVQQAYWRGEMYRLHGDFTRAEREFQTLRERAETVDLSDEQALKSAIPAITQEYIASDDSVFEESETQCKHWQAISYCKLGQMEMFRGEIESANEYYEESLGIFREIGDESGELRALVRFGEVQFMLDGLEKAAELFEESLALARDLEDQHGETKALLNTGLIMFKRGGYEVAKKRLEECLTLSREIGDRGHEAEALEYLGLVALNVEEFESAKEHLEEALHLYRELGQRPREARALNNLGVVSCECGELATAEEYHEQSLTLTRDLGLRGIEANTLLCLGNTARKGDDLETAEAYYEEALALFREMEARHKIASVFNCLGLISHERGDLGQAHDQFSEAAELYLSIESKETTMALRNVVEVCEAQSDLHSALNWCDRAIEFAKRKNREEMKEEFKTLRSGIVDTDES